MGYSQENGYIPSTVEEIMDDIMAGINTQFGTSYDTATFLGTNFYKYFYALAQDVQKGEIQTSEVFLKLQGYFTQINARIARPVVTIPGLIERFKEEGFTASVKPMILADAGKISVCVDVDGTADDYATVKTQIVQLLSTMVVGGVIFQGTQTEAVVLTNGQSFDFKFFLADHIAVKLRLTLTLSDNNTVTVLSPEAVKDILDANIKERYSLGRNFEPQRYFSVDDAPWTESVKLEYSLDGGATWLSTVYVASFEDIFTYTLPDIEIIEV